MNMNTAPVTDRRALLATVRHRKVSAILKQESPYTAAIAGILYERLGGHGVDHAQWVLAVDELEASEITIGEFLERETRR